MSPYREHQIDRPEPWYAGALAGLLAFVGIAWPFLVAAATLLFVATGAWWVADAAETVQKERGAALSTEARSWSTSVGFQVVGVYCYGDAVCDVSVGSAESMRVLYLYCVPGEGCVPR
jgi:hypothetical protein